MFERQFSNKELSSKTCGAREILLEIELNRAYAEIERQRVLIDRAESYIKQLKLKHYPDTTNSLVDEWLKDVGEIK